MYHRRENATTIGQQPPDPPLTIGPNQLSTLHGSSRITRPPDSYGFTHASLMDTLSSTSIPNSYSQAVQLDNWKKAMHELSALEKNHT